MAEIKTINQILDEGFTTLLKALGSEDAIRFINWYDQVPEELPPSSSQKNNSCIV